MSNVPEPLAPASPRHHLLTGRSLTDPSDPAYFYCHRPANRPCSFTTLVRVATPYAGPGGGIATRNR